MISQNILSRAGTYIIFHYNDTKFIGLIKDPGTILACYNLDSNTSTAFTTSLFINIDYVFPGDFTLDQLDNYPELLI